MKQSTRMCISVLCLLATCPLLALGGRLAKRPVQPGAEGLEIQLPAQGSPSHWYVGATARNNQSPFVVAGSTAESVLQPPASTRSVELTDLSSNGLAVTPGVVRVGPIDPGQVFFLFASLPAGTPVSVTRGGQVLAKASLSESLVIRDGVFVSKSLRGFSSFLTMVISPFPPAVLPDYLPHPDGSVSVSERVLRSHLTTFKLARLSPALARPAATILELKISATGVVTNVTPISGDLELARRIEQDVLQWQFTPFEYNGKPVVARSSVKVESDPDGNLTASIVQ